MRYMVLVKADKNSEAGVLPDRDRNSPGVRGGGLRCRVYSRAQGARGAPARGGEEKIVIVAACFDRENLKFHANGFLNH
jgi:hypothetical protein